MRFILAFLTAMTIMTAGAETQVAGTKLVITCTNGKKTSLNLNEKPLTTVSNGTLKVSTSTSVMTFDLSEIANFTYENDLSSLDPATDMDFNIFYADNILTVTGLPAGSDITVYSISGTEVLHSRQNDGNMTSLSLKNLTPGVYIVKTIHGTFKIMQK